MILRSKGAALVFSYICAHLITSDMNAFVNMHNNQRRSTYSHEHMHTSPIVLL